MSKALLDHGGRISPAGIERYLHEHIPLSRAMQVSVVEIGPDTAALAAPLAPNVNQWQTVFGGSAAALAILAGWTLLYTRLLDAGIQCRLVVQRSTMEYRWPIAGDFAARATQTDATDWNRFRRQIERGHRARITVEAVVEHHGLAAACFVCEYVAQPTTDTRGK